MWGIGRDDDGVGAFAHILASTCKEWERAELRAVEGIIDGTLPMRRDLVLGLEDAYAVGLQMSYLIRGSVQSKVVHRRSEIRASRQQDGDF